MSYSNHPQRAQDCAKGHDSTVRALKRKRSNVEIIEITEERTIGCLSYDDYTIGWICADHLEMIAAKAMLDTVHEQPPRVPGDSNSYVLGDIAKHNVAIACLYSSSYGTKDAATVASDMQRTFHSLRTRLMVGIGSGIPSRDADIRLGDVVVSENVTQYNLGRAIQNGYIERTGAQIKPPHDVLKAVAKLRAIHEYEPSQIPSHLSEMVKKHPETIRYAQCNSLKDRLFDATSNHALDKKNCEDCDMSHLVTRPARDSNHPRIHHGTIVSANQVMKHGQIRDLLAQKRNALCLEMEAAKLMDTFPYLVIRGICDYADSHMNQDWKKYAAGTAAAYAKELLSVALAPDGNPTPAGTVPSGVDLMKRQDGRNRLLHSLKFDQMNARRSTIAVSPPEICEWLIEHGDYRDWLDPQKAPEHHGFFWIKGDSGAGKSTLMKFAYEQAVAKTKKDNTKTVISFFFNARGEILERSVTGMYRSLLFQLLQTVQGLLDIFDTSEHIDEFGDMYETILNENSSPEWRVEVLQDLLRSAAAKLEKPLMIFVDALDECNGKQLQATVEFFKELCRPAVSNEKQLLTCFSSRYYPHIKCDYGRTLTLELQEDHERVISTYITDKLQVGTSERANDLKLRLQVKAGGNFMWAVLVVGILNAEYNDGLILAAEERLNEIAFNLVDPFKQILQRDPRNMERLKLCVRWILFSKRPLRLEEYYFAVASGLWPDSLDEWKPEDVTRDDMVRFLLSSSKGLAELTKSETPRVQFIHESVREFFLHDGQRVLWPDIAPADFAGFSHHQLRQCCSAYMSVGISRYRWSYPNLVRRGSQKTDVSERFPFLQYATRYILDHAETAAAAGCISQRDFLRDFPVREWAHVSDELAWREYRTPDTILHILAENNCASLIKTALDLDPRINLRGGRHTYPLFEALANGHREAASALLQNGTSATGATQNDVYASLEYGKEFKDYQGKTLLTWAAEKGNKALFRALVAMGLENEIDVKDSHDYTPLCYAAKNGHEGMTRFLLATGQVDPEFTNSRHQTPLLLAAMSGREAILELLLITARANPDKRDALGRTPLSFAAENGHGAVIKLLLETRRQDPCAKNDRPLNEAAGTRSEATAKLPFVCVDPDTQDVGGRTPLLYAAKNGHEDVVELLLNTGRVDLDKPKRWGLTPLFYAAMNGAEGVVKLLVETGRVDPDTQSQWGRSPFSYAAEAGAGGVIKLLLETGRVTPDGPDGHGRSPLSHAAGAGAEEVVKLLLETGQVAPDKPDHEMRTPLSYAAGAGAEGVVKLLLETGRAAPDAQDQRGRTPLWYATDVGSKGIVELLLRTGRARADLGDWSGKTPLYLAKLKNGHEAIIELLTAAKNGELAAGTL